MNNVVKNSKTSPKKSVTAKQQAKSNLTKRKNPDWDNLDRGYRYLTQDMKLPHDQAVAVMGNVVEESQGDYKAAQKNGGGRGLIQWDGRKVPSGRYSQWGSIWASVAKPANVYDSTTDTVKNYWAPWGGLKGDKVRQKFIKAPLKEKARIYAESYLRPGKPRIADRQLSAMQLDSIYNPRIKDVIVQKDGGMLEFLKKGSGIHIKEENKGKFTSYCGGKVTNECIQKGKNSSNPAIRKRATFAANARKWKHEDGGTVYNGIKKHQEGAKLTFGQKLGNFANSDLGKSVISNGLNFLQDKLFNKSASSNQEIAQAAQEKEQPTIDPAQVAQMIEMTRNQYADPENPNANGGDIFNSYIKNQITAPILARQQEEHKKRLAAIDQQTNQAKSSAVGTFFNTLAQGGIEYLQNKYGTTEKADS